MPFDITSTFIGFLIGTAIGAAGEYYALLFTDQRRRKEAVKEAARKFAQVERQMPDFLSEMRQDLLHEQNVREFFVLLGGAELFGTDAPAFQYKDQIHPSLMNFVHILEGHGFVYEVIAEGCTKYRMTEEFVSFLSNQK